MKTYSRRKAALVISMMLTITVSASAVHASEVVPISILPGIEEVELEVNTGVRLLLTRPQTADGHTGSTPDWTYATTSLTYEVRTKTTDIVGNSHEEEFKDAVVTDGTQRGIAQGSQQVLSALTERLRPILTRYPEATSTQSLKEGPLSFKRTLSYGSTGGDVKALQVYLNANGYTLAGAGPGSPGHETEYFGVATRAALSSLQEDAGIAPTGVLGPQTRAFIAEHS